jgi:glycosyltransferase involved in cell wall biosynthesis
MGRPLRLAIDVRHIRDYGIGSYIRNLLSAFHLRDDPVEFVLAGRPPDLRDLPPLDERFQKAPFPRSDSGLLNQATFPWFLRQFDTDLAHIPLNSVPMLLPRPYVVTVHDMSSLLFGSDGSGRGGLRRAYRRMRFRQGLLRASRVIAVSDATQRDVESLMAIPPERIRRIYGAVDPKFFQPIQPADARAAGPQAAEYYRRQLFERYQIRHPYLLYAGTIRPQKNLPRLIEAFSVLKTELAGHPFYRDLKLLVIGDEISKHPSVRRTVVQTRVEREVRFFGFVSFDALRLFYEGAEAFVFPSLYEGFGYPPLEAMASGVPVVTSSTSSLPEVVGDAAELVNPENIFDITRGMREVLLNTSHRHHLIERGRKRVHRFNWNETARQVLEVYREVCGRDAGPRVRPA